MNNHLALIMLAASASRRAGGGLGPGLQDDIGAGTLPR